MDELDKAEKLGRKRFGSRKDILVSDLIKVFHLPQPEAARRLNVGRSTIKLRFKELLPGFGRWPYKSGSLEINREYQRDSRTYKRKVAEQYRVSFLLNKYDYKIQKEGRTRDILKQAMKNYVENIKGEEEF